MVMKNNIKLILRENIQQADKIYFNTGKLSPEAKELVLSITHGDNYTKLITDMYYTILVNNHETGQWALSTIDKNYKKEGLTKHILDSESLKELKQYHKDLLNYNKNTFPINGFNINGVENINYFMSALKQRRLIIDIFNKLPSIASRNMREEIRIPRTYPELQDYRSKLEYFMGYYSLLGNRDEKSKKNIDNKIFLSGATLDSIIDFVEEKENLVGGFKFTKNKVKEIVKDDNYDLEIKYDNSNIMVIEVTGPDGIKKIGCNSLWCFTYGSGFDNAYRQWNQYSTNGVVYVLINFNEEPDSQDFMYVLIKPLNDYYDDDETENPSTLFNLSNEAQYDTNEIVSSLIDFKLAKKIMNFGEEVVEPKQNKEKVSNPNQLSFAFENKKELKSLVRKLLKA